MDKRISCLWPQASAVSRLSVCSSTDVRGLSIGGAKCQSTIAPATERAGLSTHMARACRPGRSYAMASGIAGDTRHPIPLLSVGPLLGVMGLTLILEVRRWHTHFELLLRVSAR